MPKVIEIPPPIFPEEAAKNKVSGKIIVRIVVGEDGRVVEAHAKPGDELLRKSAENAALKARFNPAMSVGTPKHPMTVVGQIIYDFVLDNSVVPTPKARQSQDTQRPNIHYIEVIDCVACKDLVVSLPTPEYPTYVGYGPHKYNGSVGIQILINENGNVENATAIYGHPYFRPILEKEALLAKFRPDIVDGKARKITGVIIFLVISQADEAEKVGFDIKRKPASTTVSCGVCNQKALFLPKPIYPESARFVGAAGKVSVQILIDEHGRVESARAISGHLFLRTASERAALKSLFTPLTLGKIPVKFTGVVVYDFEP